MPSDPPSEPTDLGTIRAEVDDAPLTVQTLLPALVELASIQVDLMREIERPSGLGPISVADDGHIVHSKQRRIRTSHLQSRARVVLAWLLDHVKRAQ